MSRPSRSPRPSVCRRALLLSVIVATGACGDDPNTADTASTTAAAVAADPPATDPLASTVPPTAPSPSTGVTTTAPAVADATSPPETVALPASPMVLYEWYPADENTKTIIVSDATLQAPPVRIVPEANGAAIHSGWSRDGSMLTWEVLAGDTASVWTARSDGSEPVEAVVCTADPCVQMSYPSFGTSTDQLLVTQYDIATNGDWGPSHLVLVDLTTGEQTIIASTADGLTSFYMSTMSPDGSQVAATLETYTDATQDTRTRSEVVVVDTDPASTDAPVAITNAALGAGFPRWHPTDDRILFASFDLDAYQGDEKSQLYTIAANGSGLTQITDVDYASTRRRPGEASWTPDGSRIITSIGVVEGGRVVDVKVAYVDPVTGEIDETAASGAMPALQP